MFVFPIMTGAFESWTESLINFIVPDYTTRQAFTVVALTLLNLLITQMSYKRSLKGKVEVDEVLLLKV